MSAASRLRLIFLFSLVPVFSLSAQVFVNLAAAGANDGSSWANAYTDLNQALASTSAGAIWVASGTYFPTSCNPCLEADRDIAFEIPPDVQLYGGFTGTENQLGQRDIASNLTVLSGDIGTPIDSTDNSYRVVKADNSTFATVLDGFTIEEGNADGSFGLSMGGGLLINANPAGTGHIRVRNCHFRNNYAGGGGAIGLDCVLGGQSQALIFNCDFTGNTASLGVVSTGAAIMIVGNSGAQIETQIVRCNFQENHVGNDGGAISATPTGDGTRLAMRVDSCTFRNNRAADRGGAIWYRMASSGESQVIISNSTFESNQSGGEGGAVYARTSFSSVANDTLLNCIFRQNVADGSSAQNDGNGGAVFLRGSQDGVRDHHLINCVFDRNRANQLGGALATNANFSAPGICRSYLVNCTFSGNIADSTGGAIYGEGALALNEMSITNSIFWADSAAQGVAEIDANAATVSATHSNFSGGVPLEVTDAGNNTDVDPLFVESESGDLHLTACSPLVNAGDNAAVPAIANPDPDGDPRIFQGTVDLGAYELGVLYVDQDATGNKTGRSWADAFPDLQTALQLAAGGDQIWVADGTYRSVDCLPCSPAEMETTFLLPNAVELYGGFNGSETTLEQRDWGTNLTVLSGDTGIPQDSSDNTYRVMVANNASDKTILDGFIVEEGNADGSFGLSMGGGLLINANPGGIGDIKVRNCTFRNNYAGGGGGVGIDCVLGGRSRAEFRDCVFEGNTASLRVSSTGAAMMMVGNSGAQVQPRIVNCVFRNNFSGNDGGAISATPTGDGTLLSLEIDSCRFVANRATDRGGAVWYRMASNGNSRVYIRNSTFTDNLAGGQGGAIFARSSFGNQANDTLSNCQFFDNRSTGSSPINEGEGGAVFLRGSQDGSRVHYVVNCLFNGNFATHRGGALGTTSFSSSGGNLEAQIINCTFFGNSTDGDGGSIHADGSEGTNTTQVVNSILWNGAAGVNGEEAFSNGASLSLGFSIFSANGLINVQELGNNLSVDPKVIDPENDDFRLSGCSPAIDAGDNINIPAGLSAIDLDLNDRIFNGTVDLGAYEWNGTPPALEIEISTSDDSTICLGQSITLRANGHGGDGNFTFDWDQGLGTDPEQTVSPDSTTVYRLTVRDGAGCVETDSVAVVVVPLPEVSISGDSVICAGATTTLRAPSGFAEYLWSDNSVGESLAVETAGLYDLTVTDENGCQANTNVEIMVADTPLPAIGGDTSFCAGERTVLGAGPFVSYRWSTQDTTRTLEVVSAGSYSVTVTDGSGCSGSDTVTVTENSLAAPMIGGSLSFCTGSTTNLTAPAGFAEYLWSDNSTAERLTVSTPGIYALTVTDAGGCTASSEVTVTESDALEPVITGEPVFCAGRSTQLDAGPFVSYRWSTQDTTRTLEVVSAGSYSVTVIDGSGCSGSDTVTVTENSLAAPMIGGSLSFCTGNSTDLAAPAGFAEYLWSDNSTAERLTVSTPGIYALTVTDAGGCTASSEVTVTESDALEPVITGEPAFCAGSSTQLDAGPFTSFRWSTQDTTRTLEVVSAGSYSVTVTDGSGCSGSDTVIVTESPIPAVAIVGSATFCPGGSTTLEAPADFAEYRWSDDSTEESLTVSTTGLFGLTVTDSNGCSNSAEVIIEESDELLPAISGATSLCPGESTQLDAGDFSTYLWSTGDTSRSITVTEAGTFAVTVSDGANCNGSTSVVVAPAPAPRAVDDRFTLELEDGERASFNLVTNDLLPADAPWEVFLLSTPELGSAELAANGVVDFSVFPDERGSAVFRYQLCLVDCPDRCTEATVQIQIIGDEADQLLPNAITPNGDGLNETLIFDALLFSAAEDVPDNRLIVFNRWGDIVFDQRNYDNDWAGTNQHGQRLPNGTYYYILYLNISESQIIRGDVTVLGKP